MNTLFQVSITVATAPNRPPFWPEESGWCAVFLYADNTEDAGNRATAIVQSLPFVITDPVVIVLDCAKRTWQHDPISDDDGLERFRGDFLELETRARQAGLAFAFLPITNAQPRVAAITIMRVIQAHPKAE